MGTQVLLVEDDDDIRETLAVVLTKRGFAVMAARHGADALQQVRTGGVRPDIMLLDLMMPVMDGQELLAVQPREPLLADVPVIVISAQLQVPELGPAVCAVLRKPVALAELLGLVREHAGGDERRLATG